MNKKYELPYKHHLVEPVQIGNDEPVTSITLLRKPKVKDLEGIPDSMSSFDRSAKLLSKLTGLLPTVISEVSIEDFLHLDEVIATFLPKSQPTGTN